MQEREKIIHAWFDMWLTGRDTGTEEIFMPDAVYIESWGPQYQGCAAIRHWFQEWNTRGKVIAWDIRQFFHKRTKRLWNGTSRMKWRPAKLKNLMVFLLFIGQKMGRYNR